MRLKTGIAIFIFHIILYMVLVKGHIWLNGHMGNIYKQSTQVKKSFLSLTLQNVKNI